VVWMEDTVTNGSNDGLYLRVWRAATNTWEEINGSASGDGFTNDPAHKYEYPQVAFHEGTLYIVYTKKDPAGSNDYGIAFTALDTQSNTFGAEVWIQDARDTRSYKPEIAISPADSRLWVIWYEKKSNPTEYEVWVKTAPMATWSTDTEWTAPSGQIGNGIISHPGVTSVSALEPKIEVDAHGNAWAVWSTKDPNQPAEYQTWALRWDATAASWESVYLSANSGGVAKDLSAKAYMASLALDSQGTPWISYDAFHNDPNSTQPWGTSSNSDRKIHVKTLQ